MIAFLGLWSHAVAALLFAALTLWQARQRRALGSAAALLAALAACTFWALAVAGTGAESVVAFIAESVRNLALLAFMYTLLRQGRREGGGALALSSVYGVVAVVALANIGVALLHLQLAGTGIAASIAVASYALKMMVVTAALVLLHNLYASAGPHAGAGFRAALYALATLWLYELNLYTVAYLGRAWPVDVAALRGLAAVAAAALMALAVHRADGWTLKLSRTMTFQTLSLAAIGFYLVAMVLVTSGIAVVGGSNARAIQAGFVFGTSAALLALLPNPKVRGWLKVKLAKHLFQHRYDYRAEWLRFTETLGSPGEGSAPLPERVAKAIADITDSPGSLLYVPEGDALALAARWNWPGQAAPSSLSGALGTALLGSGRISELDGVRRDDPDEPDAALFASGLVDDGRAWVAVPLIHLGRLAGLVVLGRPPLDRALDWEDFDLLRVVGRQAASYLAEAQGQQALDDVRRFDAFNRRFAFIMHDVKNLVSGLSLVARNAERHAGNPAFRADMVATLQEAAERMNALLARLAQHNNQRVEPPHAVSAGDVVARVVQEKRLIHPVIAGGGGTRPVLADPARLEKLLGHLVQNAIDASEPGAPVRIDVRDEHGCIAIDVVDRGCGMSPAFVREQLFTAFASTKPAGFGVGAYEARQLALAMDGRIEVSSREGEGSRFTVLLPAAAPPHAHAPPRQAAA